MNLTGQSHAEELIACAAAVAVAAADGQPLRRIRLLPAGPFRLKDGRGPFHVDPVKVVAAAQRYWGGEKMPLDYDHQTLATVTKGGAGGTAPASAWVDTAKLTAESDGVYANDIEWTPAAAAKITGKDYLYFSPLYGSVKSGEVTGLYGGGLTNDPAIGGLTVVAASAFFQPHKETSMSLSARLAALLGLGASASEDEVFTAASVRFGHLTALRLALGAKEGDSLETVVAAAAQLKTAKVAKDGEIIIAASAFTALTEELAGLKAKGVATSVDDAISAGKLSPALKDWALDLGTKDPKALESYIAASSSLAGEVVTGKAPAGGSAALSAEELQAASALGMTPEQYAGKGVKS